eukprot:g1375.t1
MVSPTTNFQQPSFTNSTVLPHKTTTTTKEESSLESDSDHEETNGYRKGGYHPVRIGEKFNNGRYTVLQKLGWGHFSTVWLVHDSQTSQQFAMKVQKSALQYTEAAYDEVALLKDISRGDPANQKCCCFLHDWFKHQGPNGVHVCMVFETLGDNLLKLVKKYKYKGIPIPVVKNLTYQILLGLDYLHRELNIIHTDLKLENMMLIKPLVSRPVVDVDIITKMQPALSSNRKPVSSQNKLTKCQKRRMKAKVRKQKERLDSAEEEEEEEKSGLNGLYNSKTAVVKESRKELNENELAEVGCKIVDFGNACWVNKQFSSDIQTRQYRSPEVILGSPYDTSADMWSLACTVFELLTGNFLFDPNAGDCFSKDEDHLALFIELLGNMPKRIALRGRNSRQYFNYKGELRRIKNLRHCSLEEVFRRRYKFSRKQSEEIASFLRPMLAYDPHQRATAQQMLKHPWLRTIRHQDYTDSATMLTPLSMPIEMQPSVFDISSNVDLTKSRSWIEEEVKSDCDSVKFESYHMVQDDPMVKVQTSLEEIADMQQIFQKISLSSNRSIYPAHHQINQHGALLIHQIKELDSAHGTHLS